MRALPAIDLREGAVVQLEGGDYARERLRLADPEAIAARWRAHGFGALHVVDLDAATGRGDNRAVIERLLDLGGEIQIGGGVRDDAAVDHWLGRGAARVVVGTRAIEDPEWLGRVAARHPGRVIVAADVRGRVVLVRGWSQATALDVGALLDRLAPLALAGVLVTSVDHEGLLRGPDVGLIAALAARGAHRIVASGGIASRADLAALRAAGASAAVIGMALYTGTLEATQVAKEFA